MNELQKIAKLVDRAIEAAASITGSRPSEAKRQDMLLSVSSAHFKACPLCLDEMLAWDRDIDIIHDVIGIANNYNPMTGGLDDCFWPRFAK
jgi:hypothetical protein